MSLIRILVLEDNPSDAELTLYQIRQGIRLFDYDLANDRKSFLVLLQNSPDVILADYSLPQFTALDALKLVQDQGLDIPLIIVSGTIGEEVAVEAMRLGATDYLLKDRLGRLNQAILRALEEAETRRGRRAAEAALRVSEARYRSLFEESPISLWEEDFSIIKTELDRLHADGITDFYTYFKKSMAAFKAIVTKRKIIAVNHSTFLLYEGKDETQVPERLALTFSDESLLQFLEEVVAFYQGEKHFSCESIQKTLKGNHIFVNVNALIAQGYEDSWEKVYTTTVDITARKRAEEAIISSEHLLRSVLDASPDWIFAKDRKYRYVIANKTFADDLGLSVDEVLGKTDEELGFAPASVLGRDGNRLDGFIFTDDAVFKTGEFLYSYDALVNHVNGKSWFFDSVKVPLRDHEGNIWAVLGSARDISDRLKNERALRESEELLSKVMEANPNAIYILDSDDKYRMINQAGADIFRLPKEAIIGNTNADISQKGKLLEREAFLFRQNCQRVRETGKPIYIPEESITTREGVIRWFQTRLIPLNQNGMDMMVLGVSTDISDRKFAADTLRNLNETLEERVNERTAALEETTHDLAFIKEQLEMILENSPDGFLLLDNHRKVLQANAGYLHMFFCNAEEIVQKDFLVHATSLGIKDAEQYFTLAMKDGKPVQFETHVQPPDTAAFECSIAMTPVFEGERLTAMVINFHDISDMVEVQRMKDAFVSNVSHELRTPITNFICNLELIRIRPENTDTYLKRLDRETEHLKNLIEDLLHLSRLDQGAIGIGKTYFDLNDLCRNYTEMRTPLAEAKSLKLLFVFPGEERRVFSDEGLISQVLSILLTNAINYTPQGGEIQIRTLKKLQEDQVQVGFSVSDNGPGIALDDQKRIAQRFYRGSVGLESGVSGTGLGLSIAEEILTQHGGHLEIISDGVAGKGSTFIAWLPQEEQ